MRRGCLRDVVYDGLCDGNVPEDLANGILDLLVERGFLEFAPESYPKRTDCKEFERIDELFPVLSEKVEKLLRSNDKSWRHAYERLAMMNSREAVNESDT